MYQTLVENLQWSVKYTDFPFEYNLMGIRSNVSLKLNHYSSLITLKYIHVINKVSTHGN